MQPGASPQVGDLLRLTCEGPDTYKFSDGVQVVEAEESKYKLRVIEVKSSSNGKLDLAVTSYKPSEYTDQIFVLSDGVHTVRTSPLSFKIESVLSQEKPPEPYPLFGPFDLSYSYWLWLILALAVLFIAVPVLFKLQRVRQKQKLLSAIDLKEKERSIEHDVSKFYRLKRRELENANLDADRMRGDIEQSFREYLMVRFRVPALVWSRPAIIADIRKYHKNVFERTGVAINKMLYELESSRNRKIDLRTGEQLLEGYRYVFDEIEKSRRELKR